MTIQEFAAAVSNGSLDELFSHLYGRSEKELLRQRARYLCAMERFSKLNPELDDIRIFSAPSRTEVGGNHTDHQHGCVLAGAVDLDAIALVHLNDEGTIRIVSDGYGTIELETSDLSPAKAEKGTSAALVRGIASRFTELGADITGFDAFITSDVQSGSGLSSSAAFEVLIGTVIDKCFNGGKAGAEGIAKAGQYAENVYFGKDCGLMDQMISAVGGFVSVDFKDPSEPLIKPVSFDLISSGYCLCMTDTRSSHSDLTDDYAAIPAEMSSVAEALGAEYLRDADEQEYFKKLPELRKVCSDRALLRAAHFFGENERAVLEAEALSGGDLEEFFRLVNESGDSSAFLLQNLFSPEKPLEQDIPLAIMLSRHVLKGSGAVRVHGGGFAGSIQAFVPSYLSEVYMSEMDRLFGIGSCRILTIRPVGSTEITLN